jgi:hypothetical protein
MRQSASVTFEEPEESPDTDDSEVSEGHWWNSWLLRSRAGRFIVFWIFLTLIAIFSSGPATLWLVGVLVGGGLVAFLIHLSENKKDDGEI